MKKQLETILENYRNYVIDNRREDSQEECDLRRFLASSGFFIHLTADLGILMGVIEGLTTPYGLSVPENIGIDYAILANTLGGILMIGSTICNNRYVRRLNTLKSGCSALAKMYDEIDGFYARTIFRDYYDDTT